ncbi:hypothetical protein QJQ45_027887 [Haematococcus lacustris]|nr:hypothetical protein QJQ45_027887 [Haematococcus lacustris]
MVAALAQSLPEEEQEDALIRQALDCPCVKHLRESKCGQAFEAAFTCFHKSKEVPKGYSCFAAHMAFAVGLNIECLRLHPTVLPDSPGAIVVPPGPPGGNLQPL